MDFELVMQWLIEGFVRLGIRYAAAGAFGMGALGAERATGDLDFLVHREDLGPLDGLMISLKFERVFHSEDVSQYQGESVVWGSVDFIHAFRPLALRMLKDALDKPVFGGKQTIRVLRPEDIAGLKVQAMANDPERAEKDAADILSLLQANRKALDWKRLGEYFDLFHRGDEFERLRKRLRDA